MNLAQDFYYFYLIWPKNYIILINFKNIICLIIIICLLVFLIVNINKNNNLIIFINNEIINSILFFILLIIWFIEGIAYKSNDTWFKKNNLLKNIYLLGIKTFGDFGIKTTIPKKNCRLLLKGYKNGRYRHK